MASVSEKIYCAFCKLPRKCYTRKHLSWTNVLLCLLVSLTLMFGFWQRIDGRFILLFSLLIISAEVFIYFRWRLSVKCPHCHFDPVLYKTNRPLLVKQVKERLQYVQSSGEYLLKHNNPLEHLSNYQLTKGEMPQITGHVSPKKDHLISKQV